MNNRILKNLICGVLISIMVVFSIPFHANALSSTVGIEAGIPFTDFLATLHTFLLGHNMITSNSNLTQGLPYSDYINYQDIDSNFALFQDMNNYKMYSDTYGLGDYVRGAIVSASLSQVNRIEFEKEKDVKEYFAYRIANSQTIPLSVTSMEYPLNNANFVTTIEFKWHTVSNPQIQTTTLEIHADSDYFVGVINHTSAYETYLYVLQENQTTARIVKTSTANSDPISSFVGTREFTTSDGQTFTQPYTYIWAKRTSYDQPYYVYDDIQVYSQYFPGLRKIFSLTNFSDIYRSMVNDGVARYSLTDTLSRIKEGVEVVNKESVVDETTDEVTGPYEQAVPDYNTVQQLINLLNEDVISLKQALETIGLDVVDDSATAEEKEAVISTIPEVQVDVRSDVISDTAGITIDESRTKTSAVVHIAHSIANAIAQVTGQDLPYPDEDVDVGPNGSPYLHGWNFPDLDGEDPDPGGSGTSTDEDRNRAEDVLSGVSTVSTIASSIYSSASGYNLIVTVGYSLVIFSAIIGAGHFFGALSGRYQDTKQTSLNWKKSDTWDSNNTNWNSKW